MTPLVIELSFLIVLITGLLVAMVYDLFKNGFFVWHRDSVGHMLQYLLWTSCLLATIVHVQNYIGEFEVQGFSVEIDGPGNQNEISKSFFLTIC